MSIANKCNCFLRLFLKLFLNCVEMKSLWRKLTGKPSDEELAQEDLKNARGKVSNISASIHKEISELENRLGLLQRSLQVSINRGADKGELMELTKRIRMHQSKIKSKKGLLGNVQREDQQLLDTQTNTEILSAMKESNEAQNRMRKVYLGAAEDEMDDILDDIDDHREDTRNLTNRLVSNEGYDDNDLFDESSFDAADVVSALGLRTGPADDILLSDIQQQMQAVWQPVGSHRQLQEQGFQAAQQCQGVQGVRDVQGVRTDVHGVEQTMHYIDDNEDDYTRTDMSMGVPTHEGANTTQVISFPDAPKGFSNKGKVKATVGSFNRF